MARTRFTLGWALGTAVIVAAGCGETGPAFRNISVEVTPSELRLESLGAQGSLSVTVTDGRGDPVFGSRTRWSSADETVAEVSATGVVTAIGPGTTTVTATVTGLGILEASGSATVIVEPAVASLEIVEGGGQVPAGTPTSVAVRALDAGGAPVSVGTLRFEVLEGAGSVSPSDAVLGADGIARTIWSVGTRAGDPQRLGVGRDEQPLGVVDAVAIPGPAAHIEQAGPAVAFGVRGTPLPASVRVRVSDAFDNAVPNVEVDFQPAGGSGSVSAATVVTDAGGEARTDWTLGPATGQQRLDVAAGGALASVEVVATEPPAAIAAASSTQQSAEVTQPVSAAPRVRVADANGDPVPGVPVTFEVVAGGGSIEAPAQGTPPARANARPDDRSSHAVDAALAVLSDLDGEAGVGRWLLGSVAGLANQIVRAEVAGLPAAVFTATADPGPASMLVAVAGQGQTAPVTTPLPTPPSVRASDAWGNAVPGATVHFTALEGYVTDLEAISDGSGAATTGWVLGPVSGAQRLNARLAGDESAAVAFQAVGTGSAATCALPASESGFQIHVCLVNPVDAVAAAALAAAVDRWQEVVVGDVADVPAPPDHAGCTTGAPWVDGSVDDLVLYVDVGPIDGAGGGLAGAIPCAVRSSDGLPTFARLLVDEDDVGPLDAAGQLVDVLSHEIGHALGIGTLWGAMGLLRDPTAGTTGAPPDTWFAGSRSIEAFDDAGGALRTAGPKVPVENRGGIGVVDVHWRETVLGPELMTSQLNAGVPNPLSAITVASLADLGYAVDMNRSDPYVVPFPNFPSPGLLLSGVSRRVP